VEADLLIHPRELYRIVHRYVDPFALYESESVVRALVDGMREDLQAAQQIAPIYEDAHCRLLRLPNAAWSRRVIGTLANRLARGDAQRTCAIAKDTDDGSLRLSLRVARAIVPEPGDDADALCRPFGGGGRAGAAGIDRLPIERLDEFLGALRTAACRWAIRSNAAGQ
ncbi:MAG TPA: DHHA1 domain-containing protein, partial [Burkholderiaceae bacterium]|nr:DHHA1 domain-containing protein [Burkholderiaceae bacterium]